MSSDDEKQPHVDSDDDHDDDDDHDAHASGQSAENLDAGACRVPHECVIAHPCRPSFDGEWALDLKRSDSVREMLKVAGKTQRYRSLVETLPLTLRIKTGSQKRNIDYTWRSERGDGLFRLTADGFGKRCVLNDNCGVHFLGGGVGVPGGGGGDKSYARVWNYWSDCIRTVQEWLPEAGPTYADNGCSLVTVYKFPVSDADFADADDDDDDSMSRWAMIRERKYLIDRARVLRCDVEFHHRCVGTYKSKKKTGVGGLEFADAQRTKLTMRLYFNKVKK